MRRAVMSPAMAAVAARVRTELGVTFAESLEEETAIRRPDLTEPDMIVAMLEGAVQFMAAVVMAGRDGPMPPGADVARNFVVTRMDEQIADERRKGAS